MITTGGNKNSRRPDILFILPGETEPRAINVGKTTVSGEPVKREREALVDLNSQAGLPTTFLPYDR